MAKVTLKDVATEAGVSYQTVSKVLNGRANVSAETEERIREAVKSLGYRTNISARNLRKQASQRIGYPWQRRPDDTPSPILDRFLHNAVEVAEENGYNLLTFLMRGGADRNVDVFGDMIAQQQVDGFILADTEENDPRIAYLIEHNFPFVSFGRANDTWDHCWVDDDGFKGMQRIVDHLVAQGHERIALVTWPEGSRAGTDRETGYLSGLARAGLTPNSQLIVRGDNQGVTGARALEQLWALPVGQRPTAFACVSDAIAVGILNTAISRGITIGQDVAVTGYDDTPMAAVLHPPLTSVKQPIAEVGRRVIDLLLKQINKQPIEEKGILLEPQVIVRQSSGGK